MVIDTVFVKLSIILVVALAVSIIVRFMKQPMIIGYIITGILVSPYFFGFAAEADIIKTFSHIGIAGLLFIMGLNLNPKVIKEVGKVSLVTGIGQIIFTFAVGFLICATLGFSYVESAYIAMALSFSSTIILMKLLSDKGDTSTLYGKISIGFLIVQDLVAIVVLVIVSSMEPATGIFSFATHKILAGIALIGTTLLVGYFVLKPITKKIAQSQELLLLFSITWAFALASLFYYLGFSIEIGALLAGMTLSVSPYRYEIGTRLKPLRGFFLLMFFVLLGSQLQSENFISSLIPAVVLSAVVLIGSPLIVMTLMGFLGYTKRNGFLTGLTVSQIGEFSFKLIILGIGLGHIKPDILPTVTLIGLITIGGSSYAIRHGNKLYEIFSPYLGIFEREGRKVDEGIFYKGKDHEIVLFGYNRIGYSLEKAFRKIHKKFLVVDNNPEVILKLARAQVECRYGDAEDLELLEDLPLSTAKMFISTIPDVETNFALIKEIKRLNDKAIIIVVSHQIEESLQLYEAGATYVITPHFFGGIHTAHLIERFVFKKKDFEKEGARNAHDLLKRKKEGQRDVLHERG